MLRQNNIYLQVYMSISEGAQITTEERWRQLSSADRHFSVNTACAVTGSVPSAGAERYSEEMVCISTGKVPIRLHQEPG